MSSSVQKRPKIRRFITGTRDSLILELKSAVAGQLAFFENCWIERFEKIKPNIELSQQSILTKSAIWQNNYSVASEIEFFQSVAEWPFAGELGCDEANLVVVKPKILHLSRVKIEAG